MELPASRIPYAGCPLCDAPDSVEVTVADCSGHALYKPSLPREQRWMECWQCGHVFVDGYFGPEALKILFSGTQENQVPGQNVEAQRDVWSRVLDTVGVLRAALGERWLDGGRWLDIGFGNGALLTTAAEFGYDVAGIDLREESVRLMREAGYEAHAVELDEYRAAEPFDVVSMADVLEHMPFPKRALHRVRDLLRPGGLLFVSMPNADSFLWQVLTQNGVNPYWAEIEHYHNFGRKRLCALLDECGFEALRYGVSVRYRACMELIARKRAAA
jgi:SAM-dependent methyltransferase